MPAFDPALLDAIESFPEQAWQGRVWRHMFNDYAPERVNTGGARWNPAGVGAIYTALERETAIAEGDHMIEVQPRRIFRRRVLYELEVDVVGVIDLTQAGALEAVGLTIVDVASDDMTACQRVGGAVAWLGRGGLLVPSARRHGDNMVILVGPGGESELNRVTTEVLYEASVPVGRWVPMPIARLPEATSILDYGSSTEGPVGVPASDDTTESSVFHVQEPTTSAPSAYVAGPAKVESPYGDRGFKSLRLRHFPLAPAELLPVS